MSKYTTELRYVCEYFADKQESVGAYTINSIIRQCRQHIFNFPYPIFDEAYRVPLEEKILRHFYTREICEETYGLWKLRLNDTMNVIMPYYNQLYSSELLTFNPLYDVEVTRSHVGTNIGEENNKQNSEYTSISDKDITSKQNRESSGSNIDTSNEKGNSLNLYSDTPQGGVEGIEGGITKYLTNATKNTVENENEASSVNEQNSEETGNIKNSGTTVSNSNNEGVSNITNLTEYTEKVFGKQGSTSYSKMLNEFRNTFLNIDKMVLDELEPLFFGLW